MNSRKKIKLHLAYIIFLLLLGMIFWLSAQNGDKSHDMSQKICISIVTCFNEQGNLELTEKQLSKFCVYLDGPIRKLAHFTEYAVLGLVLTRIVSYYVNERWKRILIVLGVLAGIGIIDEVHQLFIIARNGKLQDVIVDVLGGSIGMLFVLKK